MKPEIRVLIVDDEETIRKLLKTRFERERYVVKTAANAEEGMALLSAQGPFAVVVTDVRMPGMDGLNFTREIKQMGSHTKVIVMTGHGEKSTAIQSLRMGASDYLEKPFDLEEMTHSLNRIIKEHRLEKENEALLHELEDRVAVAEKQPVSAVNTPMKGFSPDQWNDVENTASYTVLKKKWSEAFEKEYLSSVLEKHHGNVTAAAKEAAVDRSNFLRLLRRHHIDASVFRGTKKAA